MFNFTGCTGIGLKAWSGSTGSDHFSWPQKGLLLPGASGNCGHTCPALFFSSSNGRAMRTPATLPGARGFVVPIGPPSGPNPSGHGKKGDSTHSGTLVQDPKRAKRAHPLKKRRKRARIDFCRTSEQLDDRLLLCFYPLGGTVESFFSDFRGSMSSTSRKPSRRLSCCPVPG